MHEQNDLNENHRRRMLVSCQYIDGLLSSVENAFAEISSTIFPKYVQDLSHQERTEVHDRVARLRAQILIFLKQRSISIPPPAISARHSVLTSLEYIEISVEELKPRYLGGYGGVPAALVPELEASVRDLQILVKSAIIALRRSTRPEAASPEADPS